MKKRMLIAVLVGLAAVLWFSVRPCAAASVAEYSVYYKPPTGSATRQPRTGTAGQLVTVPGSQLTLNPNITTDTVSVPTNPNPNIVIGSTTYVLAYVNISGGAGGGITVFPGANVFGVTVPVPSPAQNIVVESVYFPTGGGGGSCPKNTVCSTGADIDEFSETSGTLIDDTFVNVFTPPTSTAANTSLTTTANVTGTVATTDASVRINALNPPVPYQNNPTGGTFDKWATGPGGTIGSTPQDLVVNKQTDDYALALYRSACPSGYYWNPSATISQCSPNPTCPAKEVWNSTTHKCQVVVSGCPSDCKFGCYLPFISPSGQPVWNCKPAPGSCTAPLASSGCAANQVCVEPGNTDSCFCLQCSAK
jgi:hypothetical protein